jgi:hypothetical protein
MVLAPPLKEARGMFFQKKVSSEADGRVAAYINDQQVQSFEAPPPPGGGYFGLFGKSGSNSKNEWQAVKMQVTPQPSVGITEPERVEQTLRLADWPISEKLWEELEPLAAIGRNGVL